VKQLQFFLLGLLWLSVLAAATPLCGQAPADTSKASIPSLDQLSNKSIASLEKRYRSVEDRLTGYAGRMLERLQRKEAAIKAKLAQKDSLAVTRLFSQATDGYGKLTARLKDPAKMIPGSLQHYIPGLDSVQTSLRFIQKLSPSIAGIDAKKLEQLGDLSAQLQQLQGRLQSAADIQKFIKERKRQLAGELGKLGMLKELKKINKEVYYYQQQFNECKEILNDPDKIAEKLVSVARNTPAFKDFFAKNSVFAQLFPTPSAATGTAALQGLQTRASVQQQLSTQLGIGGGGMNPQQYVQQQLGQAQSQMNALKDKLNNLGGGSSELEMPDFKPNTQRTKPFLQRLEYGLNIQSQKPNGFFPVTTDLAMTVGFKLNDKSTIGIGAGMKIGWGSSINNIEVTGQGASLRSFIDLKLKGSIWISGGFEYNYQEEIKKMDVLKDLSAWQQSGLIGLTKKYKIGKKGGNLQFLWDFLSYNQVPVTTPFKFRIGYTF
jgi:hypothetical protein